MPIPIPIGLDRRALSDQILKLTQDLPFPCFRMKQGRLHAAEVVGCVQIGALRINILPKLDTPEHDRDRDFLLNVLRSAGYLNNSYAQSGLVRESARDPLEALISEVASEMTFALKDGVPRRYEERREDSTALRGRIDFTKLSTRVPGGQVTLPVIYSSLGTDNALARIIKWIASSLFRLTRSSTSRQTFAAILAQLSEVRDEQVAVPQLEKLLLSRSESRWTKSIAIGRLLLKGYFPDPTYTGKNDAFSILFPLQHLYERAMRKILAEALSGKALQVRHRTQPLFLLQDRTTLEGVLRIRPDYVISEGPKYIAVGDAKWKRVSENRRAHGIDPADLYQITAYLTRYKVQNALIFVPKANWMASSWTRSYGVPDTSCCVHLIGIDFEQLVSHKKQIRDAALQDLSTVLRQILAP